jgi:threonine dehydratase
VAQINPKSVAAAADRLSGIANKTPVITSRTLNDLVRQKVYFKCENFQRVGAFKFRGAYNTITQLRRVERDAGVITHSSGNHAQGVALAAKLLGVKAVVVMPEDAPKIKRDATEDYGATIVSCQAKYRESVTQRMVEERGYTLIHPYDDDDIIAGQGTTAWELFEEVGELDLLFVPVGGGGLISGCALATALKSPNCKVIGVEPELAADATRSWKEGKIYTLDKVPRTIADGLRPRHIGVRNLQIMRKFVSDMTTVSESEILHSLLFLWQRLKIVVEPSASVALAPVFSRQYQAVGQRVGVILSGGNVDLLNLKVADLDVTE